MTTRRRSVRAASALCLCAASAACALDLRPTDDAAADGATTDRVTTTQDGAALRTVVDATRSDVWIYLDLDRLAMAGESMEGWDVALQRFRVMTNGGSSGDGGVEVAILEGQAFDAVTAPPAEGWLRDAPDGDDSNADPDYSFSARDGWYAYSVMDHTLTPRDRTYVVRTTEGRAIKLRFVGYYDGAGTSGFPAFRWAEIAGPRR